jgi:hypothetical protein
LCTSEYWSSSSPRVTSLSRNREASSAKPIEPANAKRSHFRRSLQAARPHQRAPALSTSPEFQAGIELRS